MKTENRCLVFRLPRFTSKPWLQVQRGYNDGLGPSSTRTGRVYIVFFRKDKFGKKDVAAFKKCVEEFPVLLFCGCQQPTVNSMMMNPK